MEALLNILISIFSFNFLRKTDQGPFYEFVDEAGATVFVLATAALTQAICRVC